MPDAMPFISLIIPAFNEAELLPRLLDTVQAARDQYHRGRDAVEVIVADNSSTDTTGAIALARGCRVAVVRTRRIAASRNGGARIARGEILCFVDADFRIHPETFNTIEDVLDQRDAAWDEPMYIGGATGLTMERWSLPLRLTYACVLPMLWALRIDGGVWFCSKDDFDAVGGYDESQLVSEDVRFLWSLRRRGRAHRPPRRLATRFDARRAGIEPALAVCSVRKFDKHGDWHFLGDIFRAMAFAAFSRRRFDAYARRYWYEDRA